MSEDNFDELDDMFVLARPAKKIDFVYAVADLLYKISYSFADFFSLITKIIHSHSVNEAKKQYMWEKMTKDIEKMEAKDGWTGIEWNVLWQSRDETLDSRLAIRNATINKEKFTSYVRSGLKVF